METSVTVSTSASRPNPTSLPDAAAQTTENLLPPELSALPPEIKAFLNLQNSVTQMRVQYQQLRQSYSQVRGEMTAQDPQRLVSGFWDDKSETVFEGRNVADTTTVKDLLQHAEQKLQDLEFRLVAEESHLISAGDKLRSLLVRFLGDTPLSSPMQESFPEPKLAQHRRESTVYSFETESDLGDGIVVDPDAPAGPQENEANIDSVFQDSRSPDLSEVSKWREDVLASEPEPPPEAFTDLRDHGDRLLPEQYVSDPP